MMIVGHRGSSQAAPENTLAAFELAWQEGADAIEADFRLTSDGRIVAMHDKTCLRTAGVDVAVAEGLLAELRGLDAGSWKGRRWAGQRIAMLEEVLAAIPPGKKILMEIKCGCEIVPQLQRVLGRSGLEPQQTVAMCFDEEVVAEIKKAIPAITAYLLRSFEKTEDDGWAPTARGLIDSARQCQADGLALLACEALNDELVGQVRKAGLDLHVWTVDSPLEGKRIAGLGVEGIITNRPGFLREQLERGCGSSGTGDQ